MKNESKNKFATKLRGKIPVFEDYTDEDIFLHYEDKIYTIALPYSHDGQEIDIHEKKLEYIISEFENFKLNEDKSIIYTEYNSYHLISGYFASSIPPLVYKNDKYSIKIDTTEYGLLFGLVSLATSSYVPDIMSTMDINSCIIIQYSDPAYKLDAKKELDLVQSFRFELLTRFNFQTYPDWFSDESDFESWEDWDETQDEIEDEFGKDLDTGKSRIIEESKLIEFNEGVKMYLIAESIEDDEFKFLSLYKILEYFAPIALKIDAYEKLYDKLDSNKALKPNREFLESIFDLVQSFELRKRDKELIRTVLSKCIDLVDIYEYLPQYLKSEVGRDKISYQIKSQELDKISSKISEALYSTRNQLAHAKSNYALTGLECPSDQVSLFNKFLKEASNSVIRWYNRIPEYHK